MSCPFHPSWPHSREDCPMCATLSSAASEGLLLGEPKIGDWALTLHVTCPCGVTFLWMGQPGFNKPGTVVRCTKCNRQYTLIHMPTFNEEGHIAVRLLHGLPKSTS